MVDAQNLLDQVDALFRAGRISQAEEVLNSALQQASQCENNSLCITIYNELNGLYRSTGRVNKAIEASDKALALILSIGAANTTQHATSLINAATARRMAGEEDAALQQFLQAERILHTLGRQNSYEMASLRNNISQIYQDKGLHEEALSTLDKALSTVQSLENCEGDVATTRVNRAISLMRLGRFTQAEAELSQALNYYTSPQGVNSGHVGAALSAAGELAMHKGDFKKAEKMFENALTVTKARFGKNYATDVIENNLAKVRGKL